jgi:small-conductance mechanosensitive channel
VLIFVVAFVAARNIPGLLQITILDRLPFAPSVVFSGFGPGTLRFGLRVFIHRDDYAKVMDAVNTAIEEGLTQAGIEIAAKRQEIQVRPSRESHPRDRQPLFPPEPEQS